ncbi:MAG TPA: CdaR family protein [Pontiella sp.]
MKGSFFTLWEQIRKEKWLLLLCFVLAFLAWQGIRKNIGFEVSISNIAVDVDVPEGWAVWEKSVHRVNIVFRGSREDIRYLNNEQLRVVIPVPSPQHGEDLTIRLSEKYLRNPTGAKVVRFSPSEIVIKLDQESERMLPVKAALRGSLPEGMEIENIICSPASVRVSGARQVLDEMDNIHTEPIVLDDRQGPFKESVPIALPQVGRMQVDPDWVSVEFALETRNRTKTFEQIPVRTMCAPGERREININPKTVSITVRGQQERIEKMFSVDASAYVSCYELSESTRYDLPIAVTLPDGIKLVKTEPAVIHVEVDTPK